MITPAQWSPVAIEMLEPGAKAAITAVHGNSIVIANPGSGKTELLAQRADFCSGQARAVIPRRSWPSRSRQTPRTLFVGASGIDQALTTPIASIA